MKQQSKRGRCPDRSSASGLVVRCEGEIGHMCAHHSGGIWWPNKRGLPNRQPKATLWRSLLRRLLP